MSSVFIIGQRWISHSEPQLGLGIISEIDGRSVTISYPAAAQTRRYACDSDAFVS